MQTQTTTEIDPRIQALAEHLNEDAESIYPTRYDALTFEVFGKEYMVLTDEEADSRARDNILDSVWAFNPEFLAAHTVEGVDADVIKAIQDNGKCESNNATLLRLIRDRESFVQDAISADGRVHFLNTYDDKENEVRIGDETFYVYRIN